MSTQVQSPAKPITTTTTTTTTARDAPLPLTMPAILRNPKNKNLAHLQAHPPKAHKPKSASTMSREHSKRWEGKRWKMRRENDLLASNPHITPPSKHDLTLLPSSSAPPTFPSPLPPSLLPRTRPAPSPPVPSYDPESAHAGTFSLSLKGIRKTLRNRGSRAEELVAIVEKELDDWQDQVGGARTGGVLRFPSALSQGDGRIIDSYLVPAPTSAQEESVVGGEGRGRSLPLQVHPIPMDLASRSFVQDGMVPAIVELSRGPASLTWAVAEGFERFVVHCVARHRNLVSFSKTTPFNTRLTYILLRPTRLTTSSLPPGGALDTPPTTDMSSVGGSGTDSDMPALGPVGEGPDWSTWESETDGEADETIVINDAPLPPSLPPAATSTHHHHSSLLESTQPPIPEETEGDADGGGDDDDDDYSSSDDESASSVALLSLSSSIASLDLEPLPTHPEHQRDQQLSLSSSSPLVEETKEGSLSIDGESPSASSSIDLSSNPPLDPLAATNATPIIASCPSSLSASQPSLGSATPTKKNLSQSSHLLPHKPIRPLSNPPNAGNGSSSSPSSTTTTTPRKPSSVGTMTTGMNGENEDEEAEQGLGSSEMTPKPSRSSAGGTMKVPSLLASSSAAVAADSRLASPVVGSTPSLQQEGGGRGRDPSVPNKKPGSFWEYLYGKKPISHHSRQQHHQPK